MTYHFDPTRRAYTMRLNGESSADTSWREALWQTHLVVNRGAKIFGDWLLTFRGGLPASLAEDESLQNVGNLAHRRTILALSWFSVEDEERAPKEYKIDSYSQTVEALRTILASQGIGEGDVESWIKDCQDALSARIRDGAVWINRHRCFKDRQKEVPISIDDVEDFLIHFFGSKKVYFEPANTNETEGAKDLVIKAGHWLSGRFGSGKGADYELFTWIYNGILNWIATYSVTAGYRSGIEVIEHLAHHLNTQGIQGKDLSDILGQLSGPGYKSGTKILLEQIYQKPQVTEEDLERLAEKAEKDRDNAAAKIGKKGPRPYSEAMLAMIELEIGFPYNPEGGPSNHQEYSVILDHAARRVSQTHSWVKRAEAARKEFVEDAQKIELVSKEARQWLDQYRTDRAKASGSIQEYLIRKGAVSGWKDILKRWGNCRDTESRIEAAKKVQTEYNESGDKKFGDIQLFEALAAEEARCTWQTKSKADATILENYIAATVAQHDRQRFKVPAYRHPDPLKHPIFVEFGNSRWSVRYEVHQAALAQAKGKKNTDKPIDLQGITMTLWDGHLLRSVPMRWQGKRFKNEILGPAFELSQVMEETVIGVPRQTRFGRATVQLNEPGRATRILQCFEEKDWNARLQVDRAALERLAKLPEGSEAYKRAIRHLPWFISFTANLQPTGVWEQYVQELDESTLQAFFRKNGKISYTGWPHQLINDKREKSSRLVLCRLPNLRILSVDLGLRYGATCAVWETLSIEEMQGYCRDYNIPYPAENELYCVVPVNNKKKLFFRRIAGDILLDGQQHPAPWARLERQFFIKLQGEERPSRKPSNEEHEWYKSMMQELGYTSDTDPGEDRIPIEKRIHHITELHFRAVKLVKRAIQHHARLAIIAYDIGHNEQPKPGGEPRKLSKEEWTSQISWALSDFHSMRSIKQPHYQVLNKIWETHIEPLLPTDLKTELFENNAHIEEETYRTQKKRAAERAEKLKVAAEKLVVDDTRRNLLVGELSVLWRKHDESFNKKRTDKQLPIFAKLRQRILPQGGKSRKGDKSIRHVGGLSLDRIATITELRRVNDAFSKRPTPESLVKNISRKGEKRREHFAEKKALGTLEKLRENRCKQLASRLVEAALGLGSMDSKTGKRPEIPIFTPCHAVVIENLTHYRPDEMKTRRENRQLMNWASKQIEKYLEEGCQLYGLHLRSISPAYTSRQDSRTDVGGMRCNDYSPQHFLGLNKWSPWRGKVHTLTEKKSSEFTPTEQWVLDLWGCWDEKEQVWTDYGQQWSWKWDNESLCWKSLNNFSEAPVQPAPVRIPERGGEIFMSADSNSPIGYGIHADLNAAANIGLKALKDPDWPVTHWKITVNTSTGLPEAAKNEESLLASLQTPLLDGEQNEQSASKRKKKTANSNKVNRFCHPSTLPLGDNRRQWMAYKDYYRMVEESVVGQIRKQAVKPRKKTEKAVLTAAT